MCTTGLKTAQKESSRFNTFQSEVMAFVLELYQKNVLRGIHGHTLLDLFYINSWPISSVQDGMELPSGNRTSSPYCPCHRTVEDIKTKLCQTLWNSDQFYQQRFSDTILMRAKTTSFLNLISGLSLEIDFCPEELHYQGSIRSVLNGWRLHVWRLADTTQTSLAGLAAIAGRGGGLIPYTRASCSVYLPTMGMDLLWRSSTQL